MKVDKYDRQIRLWGAKGQKRLAQARIALLGCSGAGIQALKNMVLPGIGTIDIWDNQCVQVKDLCSSFFYEQQSVGKPKGQQALKNLLQMNPDVSGNWINQSPQALLENEKKLRQYALCISCAVDDQTAKNISQKCWKCNVPVVFGFQVGFLFYIRNQKKDHFVQKSSSQDRSYLRLTNPFDGLKQYSSKWNIPSLLQTLQKSQSQKDEINKLLSRIPFPVILIQVYQNIPKQKRNVNNYRSMLQQWTQKVDADDRTNFREAQKKIHSLLQGVQDFMDQNFDILHHPSVVNANNQSSFCNQFLKVVAIYYKKNGYLPQSTTLPDMQTTTQLYIELKYIYKKQHLISRAEMIDIFHDQFPAVTDIDQDDISFYINNISGLQMVNMNPYSKQLLQINCQELYQEKEAYISLRVYQIFKNKRKRAPTLTDFQEIDNICQQFCNKNSLKFQDQRYLKEICRAEGKQIISTNSMMGAIIAQQAVKLVTNCFCPMISGYIYNGIKCSGAQVNL